MSFGWPNSIKSRLQIINNAIHPIFRYNKNAQHNYSFKTIELSPFSGKAFFIPLNTIFCILLYDLEIVKIPNSRGVSHYA
ncbi:hypothetical protein ACFVAD_09390 [Sutcliffiella sp. NPDC057660]|uniref:hypothetical protein n=1 Tax=Sutcliffiella sp. NPDC057660 TaxID=3346199 RepID=UPI0036C63055